MLRLFGAITVFIALTNAAVADLLQTGGSRWAVLASTQEIDNAIGIAEQYTYRFSDVRVAEASNGWFAVIVGPIPIPKGIKAAREALNNDPYFPKDLFFSNGQNLVRTVWSPAKKSSLPVWTYEGGKPLVISENGLEITVADVLEAGTRYPTIQLRRDGKVVLKEVLKNSEFAGDKINAKVQVAWVDRTTANPQIVFSSYWNGAHCCTVTKVLTETVGGWVSVDGQVLNGDGYELKDVNSDGQLELVSVDNSFLYAFASYAESWAPLTISKLDGARIVDERWNSDFRKYYRRHLFGWEFRAKVDPSLWRRNGFLGGWLALKLIIGEADQGWQALMTKYNRSSDWPLISCDVELKEGECPKSATRRVSFPDALREHLKKNGYLGPQPVEVEKTPVAPPAPKVAVSTPAETAPVVPPKKGVVIGSGTGFFVSNLGQLITNHHVIKGCSTIEVRRPGSLAREASVVAEDPTNDLALLRVDGDIGAYATLRVETRLGEAVAAFGYPLSQVLSSGGNFTLGNVTALAGLGNDTRFIQISAPVQPGNSGGPLLDSYGNVIGVVTSKLDALVALAASGDIPQNVNFALRGSSLYAFLLTYGVTPATPLTVSKLEAPDLADRASSFSVAITCR